MDFDISFNFQSDSNGRDPDTYSPTLKRYHQMLWSKALPSGLLFDVMVGGTYLTHKSKLGEFFLGSDSISHSYQNQKSKQWIVEAVPDDVQELYNLGSTIGAFTLFPNNRIDGKATINGMRGMNSLIDDRFDLTLECIRRLYSDDDSPLSDVLTRYKDFFMLFGDFDGYVNFFLLQDLVDGNGRVRFHLPFDDFETKPGFLDVNAYLVYKDSIVNFITSRGSRMEDYIKKAYG